MTYKKKHSGHSRKPLMLWTLVGCVGICLGTFIFGTIDGEEFNPWTFQRQHYRFTQIPILHWQIIPTRYTVTTKRVDRSIGRILGVSDPESSYSEEDFGDDPSSAEDTPDNQAATSSAEDESNTKPTTTTDNTPKKKASGKNIAATVLTRWDTIVARRLTSSEWTGDAKILCDALDTRDALGSFVWETWTTDHPKLANVLWPIVARTAQAQLYMITIDQLTLATKHTDPIQLEKELKSLIAKDALVLGDVLLADHHPDQAILAYDLVLAYNPDSSQAIQGARNARKVVIKDAK